MSPARTPRTRVGADLRVELRSSEGEVVHGHLTGTDSRLTLEVDSPGAFAGPSDAPMIRTLAEAMAERGVEVRVESGGQHLVTLGCERAPWWQRRVTRSAHIRVGSLRGAWTSFRSRVSDPVPVLPDARALPPPTMFPLVPTFTGRRRITTTDAPGTGSPRLVLVHPVIRDGQVATTFLLTGPETTIGSSPTCDVVLPGLGELHARVLRDERDELRVVPVGPHEVRLHGAQVFAAQPLRTGSRLELGEHTLVYAREEYADHGRPYGGRLGGEAGYQRPQRS